MSTAPAQGLLIAESKHRYFIKNGDLRYSQKPLTNGSSKNRIRIYLIGDEQTNAFYAEMDPVSQPVDVMGFLARAWYRKTWHFFQGYPRQLSVSKSLMQDPVIRNDITFICRELGIAFSYPSFPPWYANMVKRFELSVDAMWYRWCDTDLKWNICELGDISALACLDATLRDRELWRRRTSASPRSPLPDEWLEIVDIRYQPPGAWRQKLHCDWPELDTVGYPKTHF